MSSSAAPPPMWTPSKPSSDALFAAKMNKAINSVAGSAGSSWNSELLMLYRAQQAQLKRQGESLCGESSGITSTSWSNSTPDEDEDQHSSADSRRSQWQSLISQVSSLTSPVFDDEDTEDDTTSYEDQVQSSLTQSNVMTEDQKNDLIRNVEIILKEYQRMEYEKTQLDQEHQFLLEDRAQLQRTVDSLRDQLLQEGLEMRQQRQSLQKEVTRLTFELHQAKNCLQEQRQAFEKERSVLHKSLQEQIDSTSKYKSKALKAKKQKEKLAELVEGQQELLYDIYNTPPPPRRISATVSRQSSYYSAYSSCGTMTTASGDDDYQDDDDEQYQDSKSFDEEVPPTKSKASSSSVQDSKASSSSVQDSKASVASTAKSTSVEEETAPSSPAKSTQASHGSSAASPPTTRRRCSELFEEQSSDGEPVLFHYKPIVKKKSWFSKLSSPHHNKTAWDDMSSLPSVGLVVHSDPLIENMPGGGRARSHPPPEPQPALHNPNKRSTRSVLLRRKQRVDMGA